MKKIIIDTNGYLRILLDDIPKQANQVELLLKRAKKGEIEIFLPQAVVFEIVFALEKYYHFDKQETMDKLKSLIEMGYVRVELRDVFIESVAIHKSRAISFVDSFLLSLAKARGAALFTFDEKLKKLL